MLKWTPKAVWCITLFTQCVGNNNWGQSEGHQFDQRNFLKEQEPPSQLFLSSGASSEHGPDPGPTRVQALPRTPSEFLSKCLLSHAGTLNPQLGNPSPENPYDFSALLCTLSVETLLIGIQVLGLSELFGSQFSPGSPQDFKADQNSPVAV